MRRIIRRLWYVLRRRQFEDDLADEMAFHREMAARDLAAGGVPAGDVPVAVRRAFGSGALARDRARDVWIAPWLQDLARDIRFGIRMLRKEPAFTAAVVAVLGVGIGVNTTQFTIVNGTCIRGLPITRPDRVVAVRARDARDRPVPLTYAEFVDLRASTPALDGVAAFASAPAVVADDAQAADRVLAVRLSAPAFRLLGISPALGRDFGARDDVVGAMPVVILSGALWSDRYGADPHVVGRTIRVDGVPSTVVGVMPQGFGFPSNADIWQPLAATPGLAATRDVRTVGVFGRMAEQASIAQVRLQVSAMAERLRHDRPDAIRDIRFESLPINDAFNANIHDPAWIAFIVVGFLVLAISSANAANLLLMRAIARSREITIRASLGASRFRIVRQLIVESVLLAALGGLLGLALSLAGVRLFASAIPANAMPYYMTYTVDARVLAMLVGGSAATVLLFGLAPALHLARRSTAPLLRAGGESDGAGSSRWMTVFMAAEFGLTVVLLALGATGMRGALASQQSETAVLTDNRVTATLTLPTANYPTTERRMAFLRTLVERVAGTPAVEQVALASALPLAPAQKKAIKIDGREPVDGERPPSIDTLTVSARYFDTLGVPIVLGRALAETDGRAGHEAAVVNKRFVETYLPGAVPIGRRLGVDDEGSGTFRTFVIVGVSAAVRQQTREWRPEPLVYLPIDAAAPTTLALVVHTRSDGGSAAPILRSIVADLDHDLPLYRVRPLEDVLRDASWNPRLSSRLLMTLTAIALALSVVGLYAVVAHGVAIRTREFGIRAALGARPRDIVAMVLARAARQIAYGFGVGVVCTLAWSRAFYTGGAGRFGPTDPAVLAGVAVLLAIVAAIASVAPGRRAMRVDPAATLRCE